MGVGARLGAYTKGMDRRPVLMLLMWAWLVLSGAGQAQAADSEGFDAAVYLLRQTTQPYRDARHNTMLRGLRQLNDPALGDLFTALSNSEHAPQRVHGVLGLAEVSPERRVNLSTLAEIEDKQELVEVLSAAIDDKLIDKAGLATLLTWEGLDLRVKQAVALRLVGEGGTIDPEPFKASLDVELTPETGAGRLLQFALAGLLLAEAGDASGGRALEKLARLEGAQAEAVLAQVIDGGMRRGLKAAGPVGLQVAADSGRAVPLRLLAIQAALRLGADGAGPMWRAMYANEDEAARRVRLALIALDSAGQLDASAFDTLAGSDSELIRLIGEAGKAIAQERGDVPAAFAPLLAAGQPLVANWVSTYCRREEPGQGPELLEMVIRHHAAGNERSRARLAEAALTAAQTLCEVYPDEAGKRLPALLRASAKPGDGDKGEALQLRQLLLLGIVRANKVELKTLAEKIEPDDHDDFTTRTLRLLARARHGAALSRDEWSRVSDLVQGAGQTDLGLRVQLAWVYLKHQNRGRQAIAEALR